MHVRAQYYRGLYAHTSNPASQHCVSIHVVITVLVAHCWLGAQVVITVLVAQCCSSPNKSRVTRACQTRNEDYSASRILMRQQVDGYEAGRHQARTTGSTDWPRQFSEGNLVPLVLQHWCCCYLAVDSL